MDQQLFALVVTATILSMFAAPCLVSYALPLADVIIHRFPQRQSGRRPPGP
jgi:hypothetical protein